MWGATPGDEIKVTYWVFQSTRPVWGATHDEQAVDVIFGVSIHAPRVGRDKDQATVNEWAEWFQSTRPVWGATLGYEVEADECDVSIHAPRVGRDTGLNS